MNKKILRTYRTYNPHKMHQVPMNSKALSCCDKSMAAA